MKIFKENKPLVEEPTENIPEEESTEELSTEEKSEIIYKDWMEVVVERNKNHQVYDIDNLAQALEKQLQNNRVAKQMAFNPNGDSQVKFQPSNMLIVGPPGGGKTGIIDAWAKEHLFNNDAINVMTVTGAQLTNELFRGIPANVSKEDENGVMQYAYKFLNSDYFNKLNRKNSVLFIDEINTAPPALTGGLLTLIQDHRIPKSTDSEDSEDYTYFDNFLFTIAAMNPIEAAEGVSETQMAKVYGGANKLQMALLTRFKVFTWDSNPEVTKGYLLDKFGKVKQNLDAQLAGNHISQDMYDVLNKLNNDKADIVNALIRNNGTFEFQFSDNNDLVVGFQQQRPVLNARTLEMCLQDCDGTVEDFLAEFRPHCGNNPKIFKTVVALLADLEDAQSNSNKIFKDTYSAFIAWEKKYKRSQGLFD